MLWSHFFAFFANFRRKNWRCSQKPMLHMIKSFQKLAEVWARNANIIANFWQKYFQNHNLGPCSKVLSLNSWSIKLTHSRATSSSSASWLLSPTRCNFYQSNFCWGKLNHRMHPGAAAWRGGHRIRLRNRRPGLESCQGVRFFRGT
jgi:hypothetical protein